MNKVVIKDVAKRAGVSTALVSYVLNGKTERKRVNKETAKRIEMVAEELNYTPNHIAKSLKMHKTLTLGLVVADISYRFTMGVTKSIEAEAKKNNYNVIYGSSNESKKSFIQIVENFISRGVDGLILIPVENSQKYIGSLQKLEIPFVLLDRYFPDITTNYIALNNYSAAYEATEYLIRTGHKRIGIINLKTSLFHLQERNRGYLNALKDNKITLEKSWAQHVNSFKLTEEIPLAIDNIIATNNPCDALFFTTDTVAIYGLRYLNMQNIRVPDSLSVLSFDESDVFDLFYCPITHFKQPLEKMGEVAVNTVIQLINHNKINMQIILDGDLIQGGSCGEEV